MKKAMLRFGCFITGYNYDILRNSSEASKKQLKKYMSAMLIIAILWGFIGFSFASRYLQADELVSAVIAAIMVIVVIQIERQIILTTGKSPLAYAFRIILGIVMAVIGSVIIDQIIFKEDIEKVKITAIDEEVKKNLPNKTAQIDKEIANLNMQIEKKEAERITIVEELDRRPYIYTYNHNNKEEADTAGNVRLVSRQIFREAVPNPKADQLPVVNRQIEQLRKQLSEKEEILFNTRKELEKELRSKRGFLDEITMFTKLLFSSPVALVIWSMIFIFFLSLELFVIISKMGDDKNDYDRVILHQVEVRKRMIEELGRKQ